MHRPGCADVIMLVLVMSMTMYRVVDTRSLASTSCFYEGHWTEHGEWYSGSSQTCKCWYGDWKDCSDNYGGCAKEQWPPKSGCHYRCPDNSCVKHDRSCVNNFDDCECDYGYKKVGDQCYPDDYSDDTPPEGCAKEQWPPKSGCHYRCPDNSCVKHDRSCVNNFDDCECDYGYKKVGDQCYPDDYSDDTPPEGCAKEQWPPKSGCDYRCPDNSCVKHDRSCVNNFDDCECDHGYYKDNYQCVWRG